MSGARFYAFVAFVALLLCCSGFLAEAQITSPSEVTALRAIKKSLVDPFQFLRNWNKGDPCTANWTGVLCNNSADDGYLHVQELLLQNLNLSGTLAPEIGQLSHMKILNVMWNKITGSIPREAGNVTSLILLLLSGNQLTGSLPDEIGNLPNLDRLQIDENQISGSIPKSFANLNKTKHFHMNNNSLSGQIPPELSSLPSLVHIQLDNNQFDGSEIPDSYGNMSHLLKLSLRNCSLRGVIPDLSRIPALGYLDLSWNQLNGSLPQAKLSENITTIDLSNNDLTGAIPSNFSGLPLLQKLSLENNKLNGSVPSTIWQSTDFNSTGGLVLDFQNNSLSNISSSLNPPANVTIRLRGNPVCANANQLNISRFCGSQTDMDGNWITTSNGCPQICPTDAFYEIVPTSPTCRCALPIRVGYRLKSPGFSDFLPYKVPFEQHLTSGLELEFNQLYIDSILWVQGPPRLRMYLKLFPSDSSQFNTSEILRIREMFTGWNIALSDIFGPYELLNFTLLGVYATVIPEPPSSSGISKGALAGIVLGAVAAAATISAIISILVMRRRTAHYHAVSRKRLLSKVPIKIDGVKDFTFGEMAQATNNFSNNAQVGQGGYGKVYKGILADGTVVAIKRAQEGSLQGQREFFTEIELLSRLHHRNLVSLVGYCDEEGEQMLVYEFMPNGTLRDHLSAKAKESLTFAMRLQIALGSSRGILYLHNEADPPIFHRDIKTSNILLDSKFVSKVADFGLSRLALASDVEGTAPAYVSTVVKGTPGYLDPQYFLTNKLTDKSDVYSLGVVFLELLTGMQPISQGKNIVREVNIAYQSGMMFSVIDSKMASYPSECVGQFVKLALKCCQDETDGRPSMPEVVRELENIWKMTPESDTIVSESINIENGKAEKPTSSTSETRNPYVSSDISGSDLSGIVPIITPR